MTVFKGHTENAGHFLQPTTMAIGHKVTAILLPSLFEHRAGRDVALKRHCERVGTAVQTNWKWEDPTTNKFVLLTNGRFPASEERQLAAPRLQGARVSTAR